MRENGSNTIILISYLLVLLQARQGGQICARETCSDDSIKALSRQLCHFLEKKKVKLFIYLSFLGSTYLERGRGEKAHLSVII